MRFGGKPWRYLIVPHTAVDGPKTLAGLAAKYGGVRWTPL